MMLKCEIEFCNKRFTDAGIYVNHLSKIHHMREFKCIFCYEKFNTTCVYKRHLIKEYSRHVENNAIDQDHIRRCDANETANFFLELPEHFHEIEDLDQAEIERTQELFGALPLYHDECEENNSMEKLADNFFGMILNLYGTMGITKKLATNITKDIQTIVCKPIFELLLSKLKDECDIRSTRQFSRSLDNIFHKLNTEHKFKKLLKENNLFFEAEHFQIVGETNNSKGYLFPLKANIKAIFESDSDLIIDMLLKYDELINEDTGVIRSIVSSDLWKRKIKGFTNRKVLPILLYQDDIEVNNPLGSKSGVHKISTVYVTFPLLDYLRASKLHYQVPASLTLSKDFLNGLYPNYYHLSLMLKDLEEGGVDFVFADEKFTVHFVIATPIGDNLALNMMLGYGMNISIDYFCRFCTCTKMQSEVWTEENAAYLRHNVRTHEQLIGLKRETPLKEINTFNILDCLAVDIVHDFLEGTTKIEMSSIIKKFLQKKYFDLNYLNYVIENCTQLDRYEKKNKCSKIKKGHLESSTLKMSASEVLLFVKYFGMYVKEHIPDNDEHWIFFKSLYNLLNAVSSRSFSEDDLENLSCLIKTHLEMFKTLKLGIDKSPQRLIPKHHIITHYVTAIRQLGPAKGLWVMRLEGLHKQLKQYTHSTSSRRNILKSLTDKIQFNNSLLCFNNLKKDNIVKSKISSYIIPGECQILNSIGNIPLGFKLPIYDFIVPNNIRFNTKDVVLTSKLEDNICEYDIFVIKYILCLRNEIKFIACKQKCLIFDENLLMIEIDYKMTKDTYLIELEDVIKLPTNVKKLNDKFFVNISNF